ncbi:pyridoxamine 5'-phosphate oxidase family protein [Lutimonas sp.]|uniref:pyridoxamine 5'-phosphate oxidase family protein n=1 Tax=Lutimonas sp. TaxID=1872403 RepID=UPI003C768D46
MSSSNCTLITLDQEGHLRVRIMDAFLPDQDFNIWFGTKPKSSKVKQISIDNRVTLFYLEIRSLGNLKE